MGMENLLSFEWGYGELKNRTSVIKQAHRVRRVDKVHKAGKVPTAERVHK